MWKYILIGFFCGLSISAFLMFTKRHTIKKTLKQNNNIKINNKKISYEEELVKYFLYNANLLDKLSENYNELYEHMKNSVNILLPNYNIKDNLFKSKIIKKKNGQDKTKIKEQPLDYPKNNNELI